MGESPPPQTIGDAPEKHNPDPPPPPAPVPAPLSKPITRPTTKWKQLPFPGRGVQTSSSSKPSTTSTTTTTTTSTTNPPILSPSPSLIKKNSRKASSFFSTTTASPNKRSRPSPTTGAGRRSSTSISNSNSNSNSSRYAPPSKYASINNLLTDSISPDLLTLFIGLNPGLQTATSGHAYAHPSNLFWRLLHRSGCTPRLCQPAEDGDMPRLYSLGLTNIVARPTRDGAELSKAEMDEGVAELERKIALHRPESVAVVGKSIWESIWRVKHGRGIRRDEFRYGWQGEGERMGMGKGRGKEGFFGGSARKEGDNAGDDGNEEGGDDDKWIGARVFVATTTSGLAASMSLGEKEDIWRQLGSWVEQRRAERVQAAALEGGARLKPANEQRPENEPI